MYVSQVEHHPIKGESPLGAYSAPSVVWSSMGKGTSGERPDHRFTRRKALSQLVNIATPPYAEYVVDRFAERTAGRYGHRAYLHNHRCRHTELKTCEMRRTDGP
jgi:hypothetical protein